MSSSDRLDEAARAAWLYYVAGNTQDQIAAKLGVSRPSAQRLVSLAAAEGLVKVRIDHPIAHCLELASQLRSTYGLRFCEVAPSDPDAASSTFGIAQLTAAEMERWFSRKDPMVFALGTGRTLRAAVEQLPSLACPQHKVVSLTGNISPDGSAAFYNVVFTLSARVNVRSYPLPMPVIASSAQEREMLHAQPMVQPTLALAATADVAFVGIGELDAEAPLFVDGFISQSELDALRAAGAVGEIVGWAFDQDGTLIEGLTNARVMSAPIPDRADAQVIGVAMGHAKLNAIRGAVRGGLINGLITNETTAEALLA